MYSFIFLAAASFLLCLALTPVCRDIFLRAGLLDHPDQRRKTHARPVPRVGGIPIAIAFAGSFVLLLASPLNAGSVLVRHLPVVWNLLPAAGLIFATGLIDDLMGLKSWQKLLGQIAAALAAYWGGIQVPGLGGFLTESWWSMPLTVIWLVVCANAFNLIDGVDGLATGLGLFVTITTLITASLQGNLALAVATAPLAGALLGFLRYNFNPASIFLGDSGSLLIGFLLGCYGVVWSQKSATLLAMAAPLMALAIPILDVCLSIARRFLRLQPIFGADRGHIHHRLLDRGFSPRQVALLLYAVGGVAALFSVAQSLAQKHLSAVVLGLFFVCGGILVSRLGYIEFGVAGRVILGGDVRRLVGARIQLRNLESAVDCATTPNDCWIAIREASQHLGFRDVGLKLLGETYQEQFRQGAECACWTICIPLSDEDYVNFRHEVDAPATTGIAPFLQLLGHMMRAKLPTLRPTGTIEPQIAALMDHLKAASIRTNAAGIGAS